MLRDRAIKALRGSHNSVRHKFTTLPLTYLKFAAHRMAGGNWTDFYRQIVDASAISSNLSDDQLDVTIESARQSFEAILRHGLQPHHRFLDYGCGRMRMGTHVIPYLTTGHYVGADISARAMAQGFELLDRRGLLIDKVERILLSDCGLAELSGRQFDVVWANSVITHMPQAEVAQMFKSMRPLIASSGRYLFTYSTAAAPRRHDFKDFFYPTELIARLVQAAGYRFTEAPYNSGYDYDRLGIAEPRL